MSLEGIVKFIDELEKIIEEADQETCAYYEGLKTRILSEYEKE